MKPKFTLRSFLAAIGASIIAVSFASAADLYWSGDGTTQGETGIWDTTNANWGTDAAVPYTSIWDNDNNDTAVFGGTTGTVTLGTDVTVGGLQFDTLNYVINSTATEKIKLASGATLGSSVVGDNNTTPKIDSHFAGINGFKKTGTGRLFLNATGSGSELSGDIDLNAGQLYARFEALGSGNIIFTGNSDFTKVYNATGTTTKSFTINDNVSASIGGSTFYYNFTTTGVLAGGNTAKLTMNMGGNTEKNFNNTANTFTGELTVTGGGVGAATNNNGGRARFRNLADSSEKVIISNSTFILNNGGVSMNFANRQLEMLSAGGNSRIMNESTNSAVTMTFAQDVLATLGNTSRSLILAGANTGNNTIAGKITNSVNGTGVISLAKWNAGTWILGGDNDYTGATTITAGTLKINGDQSAATGAVAVNGTSTLGGSGTLGGNVTVAENANLKMGNSVGTLTILGDLNISAMAGGAGQLFYDLGTIAASDRIAVAGTLDIGTGVLGLSDFDFTAVGSLEEGDYTLITSSGITGTLDGTNLQGTIEETDITLGISGDGNNIILTVGEVSGTPYELWAGPGVLFDDDANGDGVDNGLAFLLGASGPNVSALGLLPTVTESGGGLVMTFSMLNSASRGTASLSVEHSSDLGIADDWTTVLVPDTAGISGPTNGVTFNVTLGSPSNSVTATISSSEAAFGKLFGRLKATE